MVKLDGTVLSDLGNKTVVFLVAGLLIGSAASYLALESQTVSGQEAAENLASTLEAQSGQSYEVVNVERQNGLYRADISNPQNQLSTYYITQDGNLVAGQMTDLNQLQQTVLNQQNFVECISNRNAVLYGNASQRATALQIQLLGGANTVSPIYKDVNSQGVLQEAANRGIQRVPSFYYNGSVLGGVNQVGSIEEFTGCSYGAGQ